MAMDGQTILFLFQKRVQFNHRHIADYGGRLGLLQSQQIKHLVFSYLLQTSLISLKDLLIFDQVHPC